MSTSNLRHNSECRTCVQFPQTKMPTKVQNLQNSPNMTDHLDICALFQSDTVKEKISFLTIIKILQRYLKAKISRHRVNSCNTRSNSLLESTGTVREHKKAPMLTMRYNLSK